MTAIKQHWINFRVWLYMLYDIPEKWNDLNDFQLKLIGRLLYTESSIEKKFFRTLLITILILKKPNLKYIFKVTYMLRNVPASELMNYADFIFNENENLTRFIPEIKVGNIFKKTTLYGPAIRLSNITIEELSYADAFFYNWIKDNKTEDLQRLVACLYRPALYKEIFQDGCRYRVAVESKADDPREEFNRLLLPNNSKHTEKIPLHVHYVIALAYQGSRDKLFSRFPNVFPKPKETVENQPKKKSVYHPFSKIVNALAMDEVQVFGNLQQTEKTNAVKFLEIYEELIINSRKK